MASARRLAQLFGVGNPLVFNVNGVGSRAGARYSPATGTFQGRYDIDTRATLSEAVIDLVSLATGREPTSMDRLFDVVDPDALNRLFHSGDEQNVRIEFTYCGCNVTAISGGEVTVSNPRNDE